ncbi:MAG: RNA 2',3'-cyclic phosphodiesterase [Gemmatimonadota bacterium]|nr:RNA 2',3'-cyclic phosphodiesterase [Gemmatimonadota bacterium]
MRLFVAVNMPVRIQRDLARVTRKLAKASIPVRWIPPENLHLTIRFLGEHAESERASIVDVLARAARDAEPFEVSFGAVGAFPSPRRPRVIWIEVEAAPRLRLLRGSLERELARAGFSTDPHPFRPHVSLGRASDGSTPGSFRDFVSASSTIHVGSVLRVSSLDLVRSRRLSSGVKYELLDRARLGARTLPDPRPRT